MATKMATPARSPSAPATLLDGTGAPAGEEGGGGVTGVPATLTGMAALTGVTTVTGVAPEASTTAVTGTVGVGTAGPVATAIVAIRVTGVGGSDTAVKVGRPQEKRPLVDKPLGAHIPFPGHMFGGSLSQMGVLFLQSLQAYDTGMMMSLIFSH